MCFSAQTDQAFVKIPKADLETLREDKTNLASVLTYHVLPGRVMSKDLKAGNVKTVQGTDLVASTTGGAVALIEILKIVNGPFKSH